MQDNNNILSQEKQQDLSPEYFNLLQKECQRLLSENTQLKKSLEKEEFLHQNLYRQWTELNTRTLTKDRELTQLKLSHNRRSAFYKYAFYGLLLFTAVSVYFLFTKDQKSTISSQPLTATKDTITKPSMQTPQQNLPVKNREPEKTDTIQAQPTQIKNTNEPLVTEPSKIAKNKNLGRYRVKAKTFFYNTPDENTQRSTFLLPYKDSYGIVTALDDRNGFIYVTYINHARRTSKGWIRKNDLDPVNP